MRPAKPFSTLLRFVQNSKIMYSFSKIPTVKNCFLFSLPSIATFQEMSKVFLSLLRIQRIVFIAQMSMKSFRKQENQQNWRFVVSVVVCYFNRHNRKGLMSLETVPHGTLMCLMQRALYFSSYLV